MHKKELKSGFWCFGKNGFCLRSDFCCECEHCNGDGGEYREMYDADDRMFCVSTPMGNLKVRSTFAGSDYPGIHIKYVSRDGTETLIAAVEYDPGKRKLQCCVYPDMDAEEYVETIEYSGTVFEKRGGEES